MKISKVALTGGVQQTGKVMHRLVNEYFLDMAMYGSEPATAVFRLLADIPFVADPEGHELVQRPKFTLQFGGDCDDKAVAMAAYLKLRGITYRFRAVGVKIPGKRKIPLTHVWTEGIINNRWVVLDCTYAHNVYGQQTVRYDKFEIL
jgi:transglutaminase-like putative cysteine protease